MPNFDSATGKNALRIAAQSAAEFLSTVRDHPVDAKIDQATARNRLATALPETGTPDDQVIKELIAAAEGGIPRKGGGRFFGFVIGGTYPAGIAADWLAAAWDDSPGTPLASPFGCAVDAIAGEWARELLRLPSEASVGIVTGATMGNFVGVCAARNALLKRAGWDVEAQGLFGAPEIKVVIGEEAHPTMHLALRLAGFGHVRVVKVAANAEGAMRADALEATLSDQADPVLVCAQVGHIHTGACDPVGHAAKLLEGRNAWIHVDGAFGLWARATPTTAHLAEGVDLADSWSVDAHKVLNTPYDGAFAIVRDPVAHASAMSISASYLPQSEGTRDPSHFVPELSRRARGQAIYATIRHLGREGVERAVENLCARTRQLAEQLTAEPGIKLLNDVVFNQAAIRFCTGTADPKLDDALTEAVVQDIRASGEAWVQTADWRGQKIMRFSVCDHGTTKADIQRVGDAMIAAFKARLTP